MRKYNADQWFEECRRHEPELTRDEFDARWNLFWTTQAVMNGWEIRL